MNEYVNPVIVDHMRLLWTVIQRSWQRRTRIELHPQELKGLKELSTKELNALKKAKSFFIDWSLPYIDYLELLLMDKPYCIMLCDGQGVVLSCRTYQMDTFFREGMILKEEYIGINAVGTCLKEDMPAIVVGGEHDWDALQDKISFAVPLRDADGSIIGVLSAVEFYKDSDPRIMAFMLILLNLMERQLLVEHKLNVLQAQLTASELMGDNIQNNASVLSHEVRNSISTLSAYIQLLQLDKLIDDERADKMIKEMTRVNRMIQDFRRLAKCIKFNFRSLNLNEIINRAVEFILPKAQLKGIEVILEFGAESLYINGDMDAIEQVLINMLENAIQAMEHDQGHIWVLLKRYKGDKHLQLIIKDDGCGISEENKVNLFKPFFTTKSTGSGIGLAFCDNVIKAHGGDIEVESQEGQGTSFIINLPLLSWMREENNL